MSNTLQSKRQFSLSAIFFLVTIFALAIVATRATSHVWQLQREIGNSNQRIRSLESAATALRTRNEREYFGLHGEPVLAIAPRCPKSPPTLLRILNCRTFGQGGTFDWGPASGEQLQIRQVKIDLRLLRSIDGKDYYRLIYNPDVHLVTAESTDDTKQNVLLFQYDGTPLLLTTSESLVIAIAPDRGSCLETVLSVYEPEDAAILRLAWPHKPIVHTMFHPAVRSVREP